MIWYDMLSPFFQTSFPSWLIFLKKMLFFCSLVAPNYCSQFIQNESKSSRRHHLCDVINIHSLHPSLVTDVLPDPPMITRLKSNERSGFPFGDSSPGPWDTSDRELLSSGFSKGLRFLLLWLVNKLIQKLNRIDYEFISDSMRDNLLP